MRPAASLLVVRDGEGGLEVLMGRRSERAAFVPGAFVFPGGVVEDVDGDERATRATGGLRDPWRMAAVRETEEETGVRAAVRDDGGVDLDAVEYLSTWVTPAFVPIRYDTRFFITDRFDAPDRLGGTELTDVAFYRPAALLSAVAAGEVQAVTPTLAHLRWLDLWGDAATARAAGRTRAEHGLIDQARVEGSKPAGIGWEP